MLPFHGCFHVPEPCLVNIMDADSILSSSSKSEKKKSKEASINSHKEAERRRRHRINAHLSNLRSLLPNTTKTDKASLLAEVVNHVRELKKRAALQDGGDCGEDGGFRRIPGESDEATVSCCGGEGSSNSDMMRVRVSVCCEDRPGLNEELSKAIRMARGRVVRAEMATVGGRTRSVVEVECGGGGAEEVGMLRRAVKAVVENRAGMEQVVLGNKRPRSEIQLG